MYKSKKEGKGQESIQSSTSSDPGYQWESNKLTNRHHMQAAYICYNTDDMIVLITKKINS